MIDRRAQQQLEVMGGSVISLTSKQTKFLSNEKVNDSLGERVMKVVCEPLTPDGGTGGLKEAFNSTRFLNMNKTSKNCTPFGQEQDSIADTIDETVRDAVASLKAKKGASLHTKNLDVEKLHICVSVLMAKKKRNGTHTSTLQNWHQDYKPDQILMMKKDKNLGMIAFIPMSEEGMHVMLEHKNAGVQFFIKLGFGLVVPADMIHKGGFCSLDSQLGNPRLHFYLEDPKVVSLRRGNHWLETLKATEPLQCQKNLRQLFNIDDREHRVCLKKFVEPFV